MAKKRSTSKHKQVTDASILEALRRMVADEKTGTKTTRMERARPRFRKSRRGAPQSVTERLRASTKRKSKRRRQRRAAKVARRQQRK